MIISHGGKKLKDSDFFQLESLIGTALPVSFKEFYMVSNGGAPEEDWWDSKDNYEPIRLKVFKGIAGDANDVELETKYIEGCYKLMTARNVIPRNILPFATDDGGNYFCLEVESGNVYFFAVDGFDSGSVFTINQANALRYLTKNFSEFVNGLVSEDDLY